MESIDGRRVGRRCGKTLSRKKSGRGFPRPDLIRQLTCVAVKDLKRPVHAAQQPADAKRDSGGRIGLRLDGGADRPLE